MQKCILKRILSKVLLKSAMNTLAVTLIITSLFQAAQTAFLQFPLLAFHSCHKGCLRTNKRWKLIQVRSKLSKGKNIKTLDKYLIQFILRPQICRLMWFAGAAQWNWYHKTFLTTYTLTSVFLKLTEPTGLKKNPYQNHSFLKYRH